MSEGTPERGLVLRARQAWAVAIVLLGVGGALGWSAHSLIGGRPPAPDTRPRAETGGPDANPSSANEAADARSAEAMWSALAWSFAARSSALEALIEDLEQTGQPPRAALEQAIANSSDQELATIISALTRIDEEALLDQGDLRPFASRLVDVALDGIGGPSDEPPASHPVHFAATTRDFDPSTHDQRAFPTDQERIFAVVELGDRRAADPIMVKWLKTDDGRIQSLQSMSVPSSRRLWSFLKKSDDWAPGRYEVSFYTQDAEMKLLARGAFRVE